MSKIKFAVLGCGRIGIKHIDYIRKNPYAELVAVIDKNIKNINLNNCEKFESLDDFISSNINVDIVNVATPNGMHASDSIKVLQSSKNVLIEKPMALTKQDAENIIKASIDKNKKVFVVMQNRYSPIINYVKNLIDNNNLGKIYFVNVNCFWNRDDNYFTSQDWHGKINQDGGVLYTQFSHFIDTIYWLFGDVKNIESKLLKFRENKNIEFEDSGTVRLETIKGALCVINFSISAFKKHFESSISIIGEKGNIKIEGQYLDNLKICDVENSVSIDKYRRDIPTYYKEYENNQINHALVMQNAIDVLKNNSKIKTNALDGLKVTEIIETIYEKGK